MEQKRVIILLADISGYTKFMLDSRMSAVHGQATINMLIEAILAEVDIPLVLQEIEGDAVFLYAADPGSEADWQRVADEVGRKLDRFFAAFIAQNAVMIESTPCPCAICANADQLGLKIIVHAGEAMFHSIAGRPQVSGADVILAHRLLKNSLDSGEYLLLTEQAFTLMGARLSGYFEHRQERYDGFDEVKVRVRFLANDTLKARDAVYQLSDQDLQLAVDTYVNVVGAHLPRALLQQWRQPERDFGWWQKMLMVRDYLQMKLASPAMRRDIPRQQRARGRRRTTFGNQGSTG
jgi:Protein of unknown function (DUF2652)